MTKAERAILQRFRQYRIGANEMLFFNANFMTTNTAGFNLAMSSLIREGLVVQERRKNAYSLSDAGFVVSLSAPGEPCSAHSDGSHSNSGSRKCGKR